ncbi:MAG: DUF456 domain-containing protein [Halanaeroarchaeum sp.]
MPDVVVLAVAFMVLGVAGSLLPLVPGAALSIAGVLLYWWHTGYASPGPVVLAGFVAIGVLAVLADHLAGVVAARAGGASTRNGVLAGLVGAVLFVPLGPLGILIGVGGSVFVLEFREHGDRPRSVRAAAYATVGVLGSGVVQFVLTTSLLVAFLVVLVV